MKFLAAAVVLICVLLCGSSFSQVMFPAPQTALPCVKFDTNSTGQCSSVANSLSGNDWTGQSALYVGGYYNTGDGGEGVFIKKGTDCIDNGGSVIKDAATTPNCWYRQNLNGNLRQWGITPGSKYDAAANKTTVVGAAHYISTFVVPALVDAGISRINTGQVSVKLEEAIQLRTGWSFTCDTPPVKDANNADYTSLSGSIILAHGSFIDAQTKNDVEVHDCAVVLPEWYINPGIANTQFGGYNRTTAAPLTYSDLEAIRANMILAGDTAIMAGEGANIHDIAFMGFDNCLNATGAPQFYGHNVWMDCPIGGYFFNNGGGSTIKDFFVDNYLTKQPGFPEEEAWDIQGIVASGTLNAAGRPQCRITIGLATGGTPNFNDLNQSATTGRGDPVFYPMWISGSIKAAGRSCTSLSTGRFGNDAAWAIGPVTDNGDGTRSFDLIGSDYASPTGTPDRGIKTSATWLADTGVLRIAGPIANLAPGMQVTSSDTGWPTGCTASCQLTVVAVVARATGPDMSTSNPNADDGYNGEVIVSPAPSLPNSGGETAASVTFSNTSDTYSEDPDAHCKLESRGAYVGNCAFLNAAERYVSGNSPAGTDIARLPASRGGHLGAGFLIDDVSGLRAVNTVAFAHYYNIATIDGPECDFAQLKGDEHGELSAGNTVGIYIAGASRGCNFLSRGPGQKGASLVQDTYGTTDNGTIGTTNASVLQLSPTSIGTLSNFDTTMIPEHGEIRLCYPDCDTKTEIVAYAVLSRSTTGSVAVIVRGRFGTAPQDWTGVTAADVYPVMVGSSADVNADKSTSIFAALTTPTVGGGDLFEIHHGAAILQNVHAPGSGVGFVSANTAGVTIAGSKMGNATIAFENGTAQIQTTITSNSQFANFVPPGATNLPVTALNPGGSTLTVTDNLNALGANNVGKITVGSPVSNWPQNGVLLADSEEMGFVWNSTDTTHLIITSRGECGTTRATHTDGTTTVRFIVTELPCGSAGLKGYASNGFTIGSPAGGDKGAGALNAEAIYRNGGPVGAASNWVSGATVNQMGGSTNYYPCQGLLSSVSASESPVSSLASVAGTLRNLQVQLSAAPGGLSTLIVTVRVNGTNTALTCSVTGAATSCNDLAHTASISAGQTCSVQAVLSLTASPLRLHAANEFDN